MNRVRGGGAALIRLVQILHTRTRTVTGSDFVRDTAKLVSGTVLGRLITLAALPIATRLYSPEDFAVLATYLSVITIIAVAASLRFDLAIPISESHEDAANLLVLSIGAAVVVSLVLSLMIYLMPNIVALAIGNPSMKPYLWLIPLGVLMMANYSALGFWATRARRFGAVARTRVTQSLVGVGALLGLGAIGVAPLGLLIGNMLNGGAGSLSLAFQAFRHDRTMFRAVNTTRLAATFNRYRRYPIYSTPEALANTAGFQIPVILIAAFAGAEAGFLLIARQIMAAPLTLLGQSIGQVYLSRAAAEKQAGQLADLTLQVVRRLTQIGAGPLIFAGMTAPPLCSFVFGDEWARMGSIITWLTPWMILQFVTSPIATVLHQTGRQHWALWLQVTGLIVRVGAVVAAGLWFPTKAVPAMAISAAAFYVIYLIILMHAAGIPMRKAVGTLTRASAYAAPWILAALCAQWLLSLSPLT